LAFVYDRVDTRFGKIRPLMLVGWVIQSIGLMSMFSWFSSKGLGVVAFILLYMLYVIGYTMVNMTAQTLGPLLTNDPQQRPMVGVWSTALNYVVPMVLSIVLSVVLLPMCGGTYNQQYLTLAATVCVLVSLLGVILVCIGITPYDKPEFYNGLAANKEKLKLKDMLNVLKGNKPLQCYIISASSDKIAQQAASASVVSTMLSGILIGNMGLATILSVIGMLPSILFAIFGAKYAGKHGNQESIVVWSRNSIIAAIVAVIFFVVIDPSTIASMGVTMILYIILTLVCNGFMMCVTTANAGFMADIIDYELDRSGKYVPAVVTGTYSLIDKLVSAFSAAIATGCVALIGYTTTMPQPDDPSTPGVFWMTMFLKYGLAILGWICTLVAMRCCKLSKAEMVNVQKRIAEKKQEGLQEFARENGVNV
jgi:Na+/melibiose symporter-like transporter